MKKKIKEIKIKNNIVTVHFNSITEQEVYDMCDAFKPETLFNQLRFKLGIMHTMRYDAGKNMLEIKTLNKYGKKVIETINKYFVD